MIKQDLTIIQGETFTQQITFKNETSLLGYIAKSQIRPYVGSKELTDEFNCIIQDNSITLELSSKQTNKLKKNLYYYDLLLNKDDTNIYYIGGKIFIKRHITEPIISEDYCNEDFECPEDYCNEDFECPEDYCLEDYCNEDFECLEDYCPEDMCIEDYCNEDFECIEDMCMEDASCPEDML